MHRAMTFADTKIRRSMPQHTSGHTGFPIGHIPYIRHHWHEAAGHYFTHFTSRRCHYEAQMRDSSFSMMSPIHAPHAPHSSRLLHIYRISFCHKPSAFDDARFNADLALHTYDCVFIRASFPLPMYLSRLFLCKKLVTDY